VSVEINDFSILSCSLSPHLQHPAKHLSKLAPPDRRIPVHPRGTTKAPVSPTPQGRMGEQKKGWMALD